MTLKIVSLNIRSGGGQRVDALLRYIERQRATVIILVEWRERAANQAIRRWAHDHQMHVEHLNDGKTLNGLLIISRERFVARSKTPESSTSSGVMLEATFDDWRLLAVYFPQGAAKQKFFAACRDLSAENEDAPLIIVGDMNTGNQIVDREAGTPYACSSEFDALTSGAALMDLWRQTNGAATLEWSWQSNAGNGFRIDHAFANQRFIDRFQPVCFYDHAPRVDRTTDHSALIVSASNRR